MYMEIIIWFSFICGGFFVISWKYFRQKYKVLSENFMYRVYAKKLEALIRVEHLKKQMSTTEDSAVYASLEEKLGYELEYINALIFTYNEMFKIIKKK